MKITITDKFLWDIYNFLSDTGEIANFVFRAPTMRNLLPGVENPVFKKYRQEKGRKRFNKLVYYLKVKGYIRSENLKNKNALILTKNGVDRALRASFKINKPKRKDGKWIMLIFDIPEKYKKDKYLMRSILQNLGYKMFQKSVWISPYDVSDKTERLLQLHSLDGYAKIFLIERI